MSPAGEAEAASRTAMSMRHKEPWAQHALAHVLLTRGRVDEGAHFLEAASATWVGLNSFMLTHIWWHLALFYLSQGRIKPPCKSTISTAGHREGVFAGSDKCDFIAGALRDRRVDVGIVGRMWRTTSSRGRTIPGSRS